MPVNSSMNVIFPKNNPARGCLSIAQCMCFPQKNNPARGSTLFFQYGFENVFFIIFNIK